VIVLDASAAVDALLWRSAGARIQERLEAPDETIHAPHGLDLEVLTAFRRLALAEVMTSQRAQLAVDDFAALRVVRYPHWAFIDRIWELRHNLSCFDAAYIALAEMLESPLVTSDARLGRVPGLRARVEVYA
jgi:predicted nucleic acid-binding protein